MCGRYGFTQGYKVKDRFGIEGDVENFEPSAQVFPGEVVPIIVQKDGIRELVKMKWGLIPRWYNPEAKKKTGFDLKPQINARAEGIEQKATFRSSFKDRRCLIPANFFYEWLKMKEGSTPYLIRPTDQELFAFAGLWDLIKDGEGKDYLTFTIITTSPNEIVAKIHDRMPVILSPEDEIKWLNPETSSEDLISLLKPYPAEDMEAIPMRSMPKKGDNESLFDFIR